MKTLTLLFLVMTAFSTSLDDGPVEPASEEFPMMESEEPNTQADEGQENTAEPTENEPEPEAESSENEGESEAEPEAEEESELERRASYFNPMSAQYGYYHFHQPTHRHVNIKPWRMGYNPGLENRLIAYYPEEKPEPEHTHYVYPLDRYPMNHCFPNAWLNLQWVGVGALPPYLYYNNQYNHWHCCQLGSDGIYHYPGFFNSAHVLNTCNGYGVGYLLQNYPQD